MPIPTSDAVLAPVTEAAIPTAQQTSAPVAETPRIQVGSELARLLLLIVALSIGVFVTYLAVLDSFTSIEVNQVYSRTFQQMQGVEIPQDTKGADEITKILQTARKSSEAKVTSDEAKKVHDVVDELKKSGRATGLNAARLDSCDQFLAKSLPAANAKSAKTTSKADSSDGGKAAKPSDTPDRAKALDECVEILDPLRRTSASQAIDLERLRLMKEYAKDAHDHRQAFRSFWLQAAQLVLLNLLLPLLTALLGYIFGTQQASR